LAWLLIGFEAISLSGFRFDSQSPENDQSLMWTQIRQYLNLWLEWLGYHITSFSGLDYAAMLSPQIN
jgi:hypothetical protein